jgi:general nucleoside transport system permease protein
MEGKDMSLNEKDTRPNRPNLFYWIMTNRISSLVIAVILALAFTSLVIVFINANPIKLFGVLLKGAFGSFNGVAQVLQSWVPMALSSIGLMFTFTAGLWNIGMEGQIEMGAIFAYGALRIFLLADPQSALAAVPIGWVLVISVLAGMLGGAFWAFLVGLLKNFGGVNEIFGGLGFNFIADAIMLYLVYGPWKPTGKNGQTVVANGGSDPLPFSYWLPRFHNTDLSLWALGIAILAVIIVAIILQGTHFGLKLKAVGKNNRSSFLLGIPTNRYMLLAFILCGMFAGMAGALQVSGFSHVLNNKISGGYGYIGLMVGMLANIQPLITAPIAFIFIALNKGAANLGMDMHLDSNLAGVIQGSLVLFILVMSGVRKIMIKNKKGAQWTAH